MDISTLTQSDIATPAFVLDEAQLLANLQSLAALRQQSACKVLYSIKSLPFTQVLKLAKPFIDGFSVSSLFEAKLADEVLSKAGSLHLTTPGIRPNELAELAELCTHISFNSLSQHQRFASGIAAQTSVGLRVNPKLSFVEDARYNPCRPHSKLGVDIDRLWQSSGIDPIQGLHIHTQFSGTDYTPLLKTLEKLTRYLRDKLGKLRWLNLGGGYLYCQIKDQQPFIEQVQTLKNTFGLEVYIEPGKSVLENTAHLVATVIDLFDSDGKTIAILDTSVNHQPEVFEYQFQPEIVGQDANGRYKAILAGSTCLAGDLFGEYRFNHALQLGDKIVFKNIGAYSLVKASRFNGYNLPDIYKQGDNGLEKIKHYTYQDYRQQWVED
ncbi:MAG: carboxynorspermidine decarboxylase [Methylovulum sp.]|uniref:carboxynorspermidine decarboxylase n=1 Tax=Methylovulum sp. TaxID=1916980 RepID=UPI00260A85A3|nr:carboxynorspermidine decarboxylase [Methylovulum sp.]MDD2724793.1 carboxynorspermidine decarboxylase [Methylovulum sp.]MDD5124613.1 carboxynorspermidine decarboxylase [Methylovulum sp.]